MIHIDMSQHCSLCHQVIKRCDVERKSCQQHETADLRFQTRTLRAASSSTFLHFLRGPLWKQQAVVMAIKTAYANGIVKTMYVAHTCKWISWYLLRNYLIILEVYIQKNNNES